MQITNLNRRTLLAACLGGASLAALGYSNRSAASGPGLAAESLTDRLSLITGAGGNVVVFKGEQGLTLVDSGSQAKVTELLAMVEELAEGKPVRTLFNTHWHADHSGGNEALHGRGAQIIAHENTRLWLSADFEVEWRQTSHSPRPPEALPDETFYVGGERGLGGESVRYAHVEQAHTDGDIYLHFPDSNVLVAGGLFSGDGYPICDIATGGWIGGLIEANARLLELADDSTIIVPDRGPALNKAALQAQYDMLSDLYQQMKALAQQGFSGRDMLEEGITSKYDAVWGDPTEFVLETYRGMWAHTYDMGGFI